MNYTIGNNTYTTYVVIENNKDLLSNILTTKDIFDDEKNFIMISDNINNDFFNIIDNAISKYSSFKLKSENYNFYSQYITVKEYKLENINLYSKYLNEYTDNINNRYFIVFINHIIISLYTYNMFGSFTFFKLNAAIYI